MGQLLKLLKSSKMKNILSNSNFGFTKWCVNLALTCVALLSFATSSVQARAFTPGNIVVSRVGSGSSALASSATAVFVDEYSPTGTLVQSIAMPTTTSGSVNALLASGTSTSECQMTRSVDGKYIFLQGYKSTVGTVSISGTSSTTTPRVVGRIDSSANVDTSTALTDWATASNPRGVASTSGTDLWVSGGAGGIRYATLGASTSTQLSTVLTNLRNLLISGGQLFFSTGSGTAIRVGTVGTGLPTTTSQTMSTLPGHPTSGDPYGFFFADLTAEVAGNDTLYVVDSSGTGGTSTIIKYALVSGSWTSKGAITLASGFGITGAVSGTTVTLFATTASGLYKITDTGGYNAAPSSTSAGTAIATAAVNTAFRGVALAPTLPPPSVTSSAASAVAATTATLNGNVTADGGSAITERGFVYKTSTGVTIGDNKTVVSGTTGAYTLGLSSLTTGATYYFRAYASNSGGTTLSPELSFTTGAVAPPTVTAANVATVDATFDVSFSDDPAWQAAITSITIDGVTLTSGYARAAGKITFTPASSLPAPALQSAGTKSIIIKATGYNDATVNQVLGAGQPSKLVITTQLAAPTVNGGALATQPVLTVQDKYSNSTTSTALVAAAVSDGSWTLGGTVEVQAVNGTATFSGLTATSASVVTGATISFSSSNLVGAVSSAFNISAPFIFELTTLGTAKLETFDGMLTSATATLPLGFKIGSDWSAGTIATTYAAGTSGTTGVLTSSSGGGVYNYASGDTSTSTDRCLGFLNSGSFTSPKTIGVAIKNSSGSVMNTLDVSWNYEKYRSGSREWKWSFNHGNTPTPLNSATAGDQTYPADANNTTVSNPPQSVNKTIKLSNLDIPAGGLYYLSWTLTGTGGSSNGQALAIDDVSVTGSATANSAPTDIALSASSIAENNAVGDSVGTLSSNDVDAGDTFTYTLVAGTGDTDNASFNISGVWLRASAAFDFETKSSYSIRVRTTDSANNTFEKVFTVTVTDVVEGSTYSSWLGIDIPSDAAFLDYVFGAATPGTLDPSLKPTVAIVPPAGGAGGDTATLVLTYYVRQNTVGLTVTPKTSADLAAGPSGWVMTDVIVANVGDPREVNGVSVQQKTASVPVSGTKKFLRVEAVQQ
jgi:hypothetical protein